MRDKFSAMAVIAALGCGNAAADTITAKEIASGLSDRNTELAQQAWWDEHMKEQRHEITGRVKDVEAGTLSGYWVKLDIGRKVNVRCGLGDEFSEEVVALKKGASYTCKGAVGYTWTALFGLAFDMDAEAF